MKTHKYFAITSFIYLNFPIYFLLQSNSRGTLLEIRQAAEFLELPQLMVILSNTQFNETFMNDETIQHYTMVNKSKQIKSKLFT